MGSARCSVRGTRDSSIWCCCGAGRGCRRLFANLRQWKASSYSPLELDFAHRGRRRRTAAVEIGLLPPRRGAGDEALKHAAALRREIIGGAADPLSAHVAPGVIRTEFGDYLQAFRLGGASFETGDDAQLNNWHERLNVLWRNIARSGRRACGRM